MKIGIDIDGVLYKWTKSVNEALYECRRTARFGEHQYWDYIKERVNEDDWKWIWNDGIYEVFGRYWNRYPGTDRMVQKLAKVHDVHLITHRPRAAAACTFGFAAELQADILQVKVLEPGTPKSTAGEYDFFIDDRDIVADDILTNTGATFFMPNRPWNSHYDPTIYDDRFYRYDKPKEVLQWLLIP